MVTLPDEFVEHGTQPILRAQVGLDAESVAKAAMQLVGVKQSV
jgi:hypothetical protein